MRNWRCERDLISRAWPQFSRIDISEHAVPSMRSAKEQACRSLMRCRPEFREAAEKTFDLVVAQTCLHHILFLEHIAEQICTR